MSVRSNSGRYLSDGKLNIAGRWKSPGNSLSILKLRRRTFIKLIL